MGHARYTIIVLFGESEQLAELLIAEFGFLHSEMSQIPNQSDVLTRSGVEFAYRRPMNVFVPVESPGHPVGMFYHATGQDCAYLVGIPQGHSVLELAESVHELATAGEKLLNTYPRLAKPHDDWSFATGYYED